MVRVCAGWGGEEVGVLVVGVRWWLLVGVSGGAGVCTSVRYAYGHFRLGWGVGLSAACRFICVFVHFLPLYPKTENASCTF